MKLEHISAMCPETNFAVQLHGFTPGFNTVFGANGTGKSSAWAVVRETFCPMEPPEQPVRPLVGSVRVSERGAQAIVHPVRPDGVCRPEIVSLIGHPANDLRHAIGRLNHPAIRQVFFARNSEAGDLRRLLRAAREDGLQLGTELSQGLVGREALEWQLCSQFPHEDLDAEEQRHQQLLQDLQRAETEHQQRLAQIENSLQSRLRELEDSRSTLAALNRDLQLVEREWNDADSQRALAAPVPVPTLPCEQTEHSLSLWNIALQELELHERQLLHSNELLHDLKERESELRRQWNRPEIAVGIQARVLDAERSLLQAVEEIVLRQTGPAPCSQCGEVHAAEHSARAASLRTEIQARLEQLRGASGEHCNAHCQCDVRAELEEVAAAIRGIQAWSERVAHRKPRCIDRLKNHGLHTWLQCPGEQRLCGCARHLAAQQEIRCRASRLLKIQFGPVVLLPVPQPLIPTVSLEELNRLDQRRREIKDRLSREEETCARVADLLDALQKQRADQSDAERLARLRNEIRDHRIRLDQLQRTHNTLEAPAAVIQRLNELEASGHMPSLLAETSRTLCRITEGELRAVRVSPFDEGLEVLTSGAVWRAWPQLSAGTQRLVSMLVRLPMVREYRRRGVQFPLLLDDVLADNDLEWQKAAVDVLNEFSHEGSQVILFTCHEQLAGICQAQGAHLQRLTRTQTKRPLAARDVPSAPLAAAPLLSVPIAPIPEPSFINATNHIGTAMTAPASVNRSRLERHVQEPARTVPTQTVLSSHRVVDESLTAGLDENAGELSLDDSIDAVSSIGRQKTRKLRRLGVRTVRDLLQLPADQTRLLQGLCVSPARVAHWQDTARLLSSLPGVSSAEADLLAHCGIRDADGLSRTAEDELSARLRWFRFTSRIKPAAAMDADRLRELIHTSRNPRRIENSERLWNSSGMPRRRRSRRSRRSTQSFAGLRTRNQRQSVREPHLAAEVDSTSESRSSTRRRRSPGTRSSAEAGESSLRFRLSRSSPVVDAPSIGPKTARRLNRVKIRTVADLLNCDPYSVSEQLGDGQIKSETIQNWQAQAKLICCIPEIHGHDAQMLVACGIQDPSRLAVHDPQELHKVISAFATSTPGKRILRSGKPPDLEEIASWIDWSRKARSLEAA